MVKTLRAMVNSAKSRGHTIVEVTADTDTLVAPGVFAICTTCNGTLRWYNERGGGEASYTWCPPQSAYTPHRKAQAQT